MTRNRNGRHLENLFCASYPEPQGQLTWNLVGSIMLNCRSNIDKIVSIRNPRWMPRLSSWKSILKFFSLTQNAKWLQNQKAKLTRNLVGSIGTTCRWRPSWISILRFFSGMKFWSIIRHNSSSISIPPLKLFPPTDQNDYCYTDMKRLNAGMSTSPPFLHWMILIVICLLLN